MATETELKLRITPDAAAALVRHPALKPLKRARSRASRLTSTYYDTADGSLAAAGVALRLRRDGRHWVQTVKGPADPNSAGGLSARPEFEWPVNGPRLDPLRFATTPYRRALGKAEQRGLAPRFTTDITRTVIPLTFPDSTMARLCIDVGEVRTDDGEPTLRAPMHEIELELEAGDARRLYELAQTLAADLPLAVQTSSKAERGYALRQPRHAEPVHAHDADLPGKCAAGEAFAAIMRSCLAQIEGNAQGVIASEDPEWIHQMRIGVRRLRACLSLARGGIATERIEPLRVELRWLAHALGPARDLDVFVSSTLPAFREAAARGTGGTALAATLAKLASRAATRRREARKHARAAVVSPRFLRLVLAAAALAASPEVNVDSRTHDGTLAQPARDVARPLLKRRHQALVALSADLANAAPEARHAARLAAKKLRYAAEFFASLYSRKKTRAYRKALAALQEELGAWNDAAVAARIAAELTDASSPAAAAFSGWAMAQGAARAEALAAAWERFTKARPFWSR
ncbi:MAG TPA: CYTH and CHAD domain-containing protein [Casimicrobiaceae bacterium]|nr:CYTH and CHAD domain-containing protein [Casimicrobiaceae bacterium]